MDESVGEFDETTSLELNLLNATFISLVKAFVFKVIATRSEKETETLIQNGLQEANHLPLQDNQV